MTYKDWKAGFVKEVEHTVAAVFISTNATANSSSAKTKENSIDTEKSGIINKSKDLELFPLINLPSDNQKIRPNTIAEELNSNAMGQEAIAYLKEYNLKILMNYAGAEEGVRATQQGHAIKLNINNLSSDVDAGAAVIHEITHHKYNIGGNQWAETVCFVQEYKYINGVKDVPYSVKKKIIKGVKKVYEKYKWR